MLQIYTEFNGLRYIRCSDSSDYPLIFGQVLENLASILVLKIRSVVSSGYNRPHKWTWYEFFIIIRTTSGPTRIYEIGDGFALPATGPISALTCPPYCIGQSG